MYTFICTAVGTDCQCVVRFMGPCRAKTRRLDLRPRMCPPLKQPHSQDPGYVSFKDLFLGLFDVTRRAAVADGTVLALFDTVWHCFDSMTLLY